MIYQCPWPRPQWKLCKTCREEKPIQAFVRCDKTKDGCTGSCRTCVAAWKVAWYHRQPSALLTQRRWAVQNADKLRRVRQHYRNLHPQRAIDSAARWSRANREKRRAHLTVKRAIRKGVLVRPDTCTACHTPCRPEAHHADYTKPLAVQWLCQHCHGLTRRLDQEDFSREVA